MKPTAPRLITQLLTWLNKIPTDGFSVKGLFVLFLIIKKKKSCSVNVCALQDKLLCYTWLKPCWHLRHSEERKKKVEQNRIVMHILRVRYTRAMKDELWSGSKVNKTSENCVPRSTEDRLKKHKSIKPNTSNLVLHQVQQPINYNTARNCTLK